MLPLNLFLSSFLNFNINLGIFQFSSVALSCATFCYNMDCSTLGLPTITNSQSLPKTMSIGSVMSSNHLILCHPLLLRPSIFPSIRVFQMVQFFASGCQSIEVSASASVLPVSIQDWHPLGWTCLVSSLSKELSRTLTGQLLIISPLGSMWSLPLFLLHRRNQTATWNNRLV